MSKNWNSLSLNKPSKSTLLKSAGTIISLGLLIFLLSKQGWEEIISAFHQLSPWVLLLSLGFITLSRLSIVARWFVLLRAANIDISYQKTLRITFAGLFATNFLPTTIGGDVVRLTGMIRYHYDTVVATASLITDRLVGMTGMAMALPLVIPGLIHAGGIKQLIPQNRNNIYISASTVAFSQPWQRLWNNIKNIGSKLLKALIYWLKKPRSLILSLAFTWLNMLCLYAIIYLLLTGMNEHISFWQIGGLYSLVYFLTLLPISINGYGVQELSITVIFSTLADVSINSALTMALIFRTLTMIASLPGALFLSGVLAGDKSTQDEAVVTEHDR